MTPHRIMQSTPEGTPPPSYEACKAVIQLARCQLLARPHSLVNLRCAAYVVDQAFAPRIAELAKLVVEGRAES